MSTDTVDDLHAAEDYGESLRVKARRVIESRVALGSARTMEYPEAERAFVDAMEALDEASEERFVRPGCETEDEAHGTDAACVQGSDCGGYHPWQDEKEETET